MDAAISALHENARTRREQLVDIDLSRLRRLAYGSRAYVVSTSGFTLPAI